MQKLYQDDEVLMHSDMGELLLTRHHDLDRHIYSHLLIKQREVNSMYIIIKDREPNTINDSLKTMLERFNRP